MRLWLVALCPVLACGGDDAPAEASAGSSTSLTNGTDPGTSAGPTGSGSGSATSEGSTDPGTDSGEESDSSSPTPEPQECNGQILQCGNGEDDDDDGLIDLLDPECTGPCDDDESSFATGLPGDNVDCKQDCFFDGNSGQGDDGCDWDLRCDPANPGANIGCEYSDGNNCPDDATQSQECIDFCGQYVPPGCDCFGCCTVDTPDGPVDIFLNSGPDCSLDNLEACQTCTSRIDECGESCDPDDCDLCFGESELPEGCDEPTCPTETCDSDHPESCPDGYYCQLGCCYPPQG